MFEEEKLEVEDTTSMSGQETADGGVSVRDAIKRKIAEREQEETKQQETTAQPQVEQPSIDYKAEIDKLRASLEREKTTRQYEREARKKAEQRVRELKNNPIQEEDEEDSSIDIGEDVIEQKINAKLEAFQKQQQTSLINTILRDMSSNEDERELIRLNYENKIRPSGYDVESIENDLKDAYLMANRMRFEATIQEKTVAKVKKDSATAQALKFSANNGGSVGREPPETQKVILTPEEERFLKAFGKGAKDRYLQAQKNN